MSRPFAPLFIATLLSLSGCDLLGIESPQLIAERRQAEGKAVGGACRHAGRAIEDCYTLNKKAEKASVYAGWRDMNDYMRENKLEPVAPSLSQDTAAARAESEPASDKKKPGKPADKARKQDS